MFTDKTNTGHFRNSEQNLRFKHLLKIRIDKILIMSISAVSVTHIHIQASAHYLMIVVDRVSRGQVY